NHPITDEHYIKYIFVTYGDTIIKKELVNSNETCIYINEDIENFDVYSYCNIHGLWMIKI
ncbi:MAG: desulfoferrodoxin family protein, partial [Clostridia bacterium]